MHVKREETVSSKIGHVQTEKKISLINAFGRVCLKKYASYFFIGFESFEKKIRFYRVRTQYIFSRVIANNLSMFIYHSFHFYTIL